MLVDLYLESQTLKGIIGKTLKLAIKLEYVSYLIKQFMMSIRQVSRTLSLSWAVFCYQEICVVLNRLSRN